MLIPIPAGPRKPGQSVEVVSSLTDNWTAEVVEIIGGATTDGTAGVAAAEVAAGEPDDGVG
ncbi:MAG: hypothetical protein ACKVT0_15530 [Planctomycetaceae bacterium]